MSNNYTLDYQGLSLGEHHISFDFSDDLFAIWNESPIEKGSGRVDIDMVRHASFLELDVRITGVVELECDRCTDIYDQPVDFEGSVVVKISDAAPKEESDGDIIWIAQNEKLDLKQWIYESILLSLPLQRVHANQSDCNAEVIKYIQQLDDIK